jgi:NAD(P)-dependent dehydrogenase (short-subunit alcohol dehydrogenase family)
MAVVLITGCSTGIGLETALAFARRGDTTIATMRNVAKADALKKRAADEGVDIEIEALDVVDEFSVSSTVGKILAHHGQIDVLVNNAGVGFGGPVETMPIDAARSLMETNFWGALRMMRAVLPGMRDRRSGAIVNVTSTAARIPGTPYEGMYAASKHALGALSESLATELMPFAVRVVCIEPGFFSTAISDTSNAVEQGVNGTAYEVDGTWFHGFMTQSVESGADPSLVADAIVGAATDPNTPLHTTVGDDAALFVELATQAGTWEGWIAMSMPIVEAAVGPRPVLPAN